jgi:hypothetical protein
MRLDRAFIEAGGDHAPILRVYSFQLDIAASEGATDDARRRRGAKESGEAVAALLDAAMHPQTRPRCVAREEGEEALAAITDGLAALDRRNGRRTDHGRPAPARSRPQRPRPGPLRPAALPPL